MKKQFSEVRWQRVSLTVAVGVALVLALSTAYAKWRARDGWCVQFAPDGSEQVLYGADCQSSD